ncbi:hypothetical protein BD626DRAFT_541872 [Schizophyllum amplum]|uniref:Uncharacterized protein n=1 Tax=Schizophyllum amplum TaxID=97359 RepID=A0A550BTB1_9AGAR|nr:hypothetical protein BD626DRAFT_541872 [Auriculariopsis ampla]
MSGAAILPNSGFPVSTGVPMDFDFAAWKADVAEVENYALTFDERNERNKVIQIKNDASRAKTTLCMEDPEKYPDTGPCMIPLYANTGAEIGLATHMTHLWSTFARSLQMKISETATKLADAKMKKNEPAPAALLGPRTHRPMGAIIDAAIPECYLIAIGYGIVPPLTFFDDKVMATIANMASLPMTALSGIRFAAGTKAPRIVDFAALVKRGFAPNDFSIEDITFSDYNKWMDRLIKGVRARTDFTKIVQPGECFLDTELTNHLKYFIGARDAEKLYPAWYPLARHFLYNVINGMAFDTEEYNREWTVERATARDDVASYRSPWVPGGRQFDPALGHDGPAAAAAAAQSAYTQVEVTRAYSDTDYAPRKAPRTSYGGWAGAARGDEWDDHPGYAHGAPVALAPLPAGTAAADADLRATSHSPPICL